MPDSLDRSVTTRLSGLFEVEPDAVTAARMDARVRHAIDGMAAIAPGRRPAAMRRRRRRTLAVVGIAAVIATVAATPTIRRAFDSWFGGDFGSVWDLATPINRSAIDQGYEVTLVRAYGDPVGLYLAMSVKDLEDRGWDEIHAQSPTVVDADGVAYPPISGEAGASTSTSAEGLWRYIVPPDASHAGPRRLTATLDGIATRAVDPPDATPGDADEELWSSEGGHWAFVFDLEFLGALEAMPDVTASASGVDVRWTGLTVTPAATVVELQFTGLPPREPDWAWDPYVRLEHDGVELTSLIWSPGSVLDAMRIETETGFENLAGTWTITIDEFHRDIPDPDSEVTTESESIVGPWVLTFDGPPSP